MNIIFVFSNEPKAPQKCLVNKVTSSVALGRILGFKLMWE